MVDSHLENIQSYLIIFSIFLKFLMQLVKEPFSIIFKNKIMYEGSKLLILFSVKISCTYLSISDFFLKKNYY